MSNPTPEDFRAARARTGLTQREASKVIFGPDSDRTIQNWESGTRQIPQAKFVLFLLMTDQITVADARKAVNM